MNDTRQVRIAAVGDIHFNRDARGTMREMFATIDRDADILALCGDLTTNGRPEQAAALIEELEGVQVPIIAVLGNHDHESEATDELAEVLHAGDIHVLRGEKIVIDGVGFVGVKGFAGGFGRGALAPFGEKLIKDFVQHVIDDALALENTLRTLEADVKVVLMHYSPIIDTIVGERESIHPFLGSSRLVQPIDTMGADVVFHGHAHHGSPEGRTPGGITVYNVALPLLRKETGGNYRVWQAEAPERRRRTA